MTIPLMESVTLSTLPKPILARVEIGRPDAWRGLGSHREVQTITSALNIDAVLSGMRWWMHKYPVLSVLFSTTLFFLTACLIALIIYLTMAPPFSSPSSPSMEKPQKRVEPAPPPPPQVAYQTYEKPPTYLANDMVDVSAEPSIKSEETEGEMSDWSDTFLGSERKPPTNMSSEAEGSGGLRARISSRTESTDSLSTLSGDVRRRLAG